MELKKNIILTGHFHDRKIFMLHSQYNGEIQGRGERAKLSFGG